MGNNYLPVGKQSLNAGCKLQKSAHFAEEKMLRILGRITSINVRKALWVADELDLAYEREDWGLPIRNPRDPAFLALNPNALVPVLVEDGFVLYESNPIMRYLAERQGGALLPRDLRQRALMEQWLAWQSTEVAPSWTYAFLALGRPTPGFDDRRQIDASIIRWSGKMEILEAQLGRQGPFVTGDNFTLADVALGVAVHRWFATPFAKPEMPKLGEYYQLLKGRAAGETYMGPQTP